MLVLIEEQKSCSSKGEAMNFPDRLNAAHNSALAYFEYFLSLKNVKFQ